MCLIATILFGLVPAIASEPDRSCRPRWRSIQECRRRPRPECGSESGLVALQVALSFVLLVGAGILLKSLKAMQYERSGILSLIRDHFSVDMAAAGYDPARIRNFQDH